MDNMDELKEYYEAVLEPVLRFIKRLFNILTRCVRMLLHLLLFITSPVWMLCFLIVAFSWRVVLEDLWRMSDRILNMLWKR